MSLISGNIKRLREDAGWTQADLARITGINEKYISAIDRGVKNPSLKTITKLAEAFGIDERVVRFGDKLDAREHVKKLHEEIDRVFLKDKDDADQLILAGRVLKLLRGEDV